MDIKEKIEAAWLQRAEAQELGKPESAKYRRAELEFFMGASVAINALDDTPRDVDKMSTKVPVVWLFNVLTGNNVVERSAMERTGKLEREDAARKMSELFDRKNFPEKGVKE